MQNNASFPTMIEQPSMFARLASEIQEASREFREDPRSYVTSALKRDAGGGRRKMLLRVGLAIAILFYAIAFISMLIFWSLAHPRAQESGNSKPTVMISLPNYRTLAAMPEGEKEPSGGGGGGRHTLADPSGGNLPAPSLTQLVVAPRPEPQLTPPVLPMIEKVMVDPRIVFKQDDLSATGLPNAPSVTPSAGQGSDGGIGAGSHGGIGPGDGPGTGPGRGGGLGDGNFTLGVGRPNTASHQPVVDERPILLNQPRPLFTEEARKNKVQGVVRVKILVDTNGTVKEVVVMRGLPDGLNEQAIRAAYQMRFKPAMKNGRPVSYWMSNVEVEFNLR